MTKSNTNPDDLGGLANQLTNEFGNLANEAKYAAVTAENDEVRLAVPQHTVFLETLAMSAGHVSFSVVFMLLMQISLILYFSDWFSH